jgi:hypothetical protein
VTTAEKSTLPVVVERWKRYGHDRAYVRVAGEKAGYRDLRTGAVECGDPRLVEVLTRATDHLLHRPAMPPPPYTPRHARQEVEAPSESAVDAEAENEIAERLGKLPAGWRVLHELPVGDNGRDVDHVVIGPAGVFTVDAQDHPEATVWVRGETFRVNGRKQSCVRNCRIDAQHAAKLLSKAADTDVSVHGVIAVLGAQRGFAVKEQPPDVTVVTRRTITAYLHSLPRVLDGDAVEHIYEAACRLMHRQASAREPSLVPSRAASEG